MTLKIRFLMLILCSMFFSASTKNCKPFWRLRLRRGSVERLPSNGEGFRDIHHSMSTVLNLGFHIWFIMTLYYKMRKILLQNATVILLQNTTEVYYKMRQVFYYKMRQLLQIAMILLQNVTVITKCDVYYKLRQCTVPVLRQVANLEVTLIRDRNDIKKIHLENSSIFRQFWKSNWRVIHVESMSFFPRRFLFHNLWNISIRKLKIDGKSKKMLGNLIKTSQY